jgi:hypothetical protein
MKAPNTIWQHGTGAIIEHPGQALLLRHTGNALRVVGVAGSTNWLHYPIQLQQRLATSAAHLLRILMRYRCDSPTALITNVMLYDAEVCVFKAAGLNLCAYEWDDIALAVDPELRVTHGLNLSIGIRFDGADNDTHALEISGVGVEIDDEKKPM